jgi:hypothetical protein
MPRRWLLLPPAGRLLVSTDLHGNGDDFRRLGELFLQHVQVDPDTYWVLLGDAVHAPSPDARRRRPDLYDFPDESLAIVRGVLGLQAAWPGHVLYVLGNHDHGHVGGPPTRKFYPDEVADLEASLAPAERGLLRQLFEPALLAVVAPCGLLLSHGSPDDTLQALEDLDRIDWPQASGDGYLRRVRDGFLTSYGQPGEVTARLLAGLSARGGLDLHLVVHGHDRDEQGYFTEGGNQACPVLFGAPRERKRYLWLDLAGRYRRVEDLREGHEVLRLHAESSAW